MRPAQRLLDTRRWRRGRATRKLRATATKLQAPLQDDPQPMSFLSDRLFAAGQVSLQGAQRELGMLTREGCFAVQHEVRVRAMQLDPANQGLLKLLAGLVNECRNL